MALTFCKTRGCMAKTTGNVPDIWYCHPCELEIRKKRILSEKSGRLSFEFASWLQENFDRLVKEHNANPSLSRRAHDAV